MTKPYYQFFEIKCSECQTTFNYRTYKNGIATELTLDLADERQIEISPASHGLCTICILPAYKRAGISEEQTKSILERMVD